MYSNPPGGSSITQLVKACARGGWKQAMLADTNLCGAFAFAQATADERIRPVYALDITDGTDNAVLVARTQTGYSNLCALLSAKNLNRTFSLVDDLPALQNGLITLCSDVHSLSRLTPRLRRNYVYAEVIRPGSFRHEKQLLDLAKKLGVRLIASADVRYVDTSHLPRLHMLSAIRSNCLLSQVDPDSGRRSLPSSRAFGQLFHDLPTAVCSLNALSESCAVNPWSTGLVFPKVGGDAESKLRQLALNGLGTRYPEVDASVQARLAYEIDTVVEMGFADYFLVVADIVAYARTLGSPVACRGSGAGCLLAYCMGISNVDPIRYHLPFERFLNKGRDDAPDLDIDLCHLVRDAVIRYVFDHFGSDHVAMISTHIALQPRSALRLCAKAMGFSGHSISALRQYAGRDSREWTSCERRTQTVLNAARELIGAPHHLSLHPGGIVITPGQIALHTPLIRSSKGVVASMYDKDGVEAAGLVKIDLLGNRGLSAFGESSRLIRLSTGEAINPERPPHADDAVQRLLQTGNTLGVNQLESPAMRRLLIQMTAKSPEDIMRALALVRPGAAGMGTKQQFIKYARNVEPPPMLNPRVPDVLNESYGLLIYEDDILQVLDALAGMTPAEAQIFRKQLCRCRSHEQRKPLAAEYFHRTSSRRVPTYVALEMWAQMCKFNAYSFCRAHAASYGLLAWSNCWAKAHYPGEFWIGALNHNQGMYALWVYAEAVKQAGIRLLPPSVNHSQEMFSLESDGIRCGLDQIAHLSAGSRRSILSARPFDSFQDFTHRTNLGINELQALIRCGALDGFKLNRPQMLAAASRARPLSEVRRVMPTLFGYNDAEAPVPLMDPFSAGRTFTDEWQYLGLSVGRHPVTRIAGKPSGDESVSPLTPEMAGKTVVMRGMLAAYRRISPDSGESMCFLTLSDEGGLFEVTVRPETYSACRNSWDGESFLRIAGTICYQYGCASVDATDIEPLTQPQ